MARTAFISRLIPCVFISGSGGQLPACCCAAAWGSDDYLNSLLNPALREQSVAKKDLRLILGSPVCCVIPSPPPCLPACCWLHDPASLPSSAGGQAREGRDPHGQHRLDVHGRQGASLLTLRRPWRASAPATAPHPPLLPPPYPGPRDQGRPRQDPADAPRVHQGGREDCALAPRREALAVRGGGREGMHVCRGGCGWESHEGLPMIIPRIYVRTV